jgi:DUF1016 N-terminal domain
MTKAVAKTKSAAPAAANYSGLVGGISELLDAARRASVRTVNAFMTATYWEIGRRIVEFEQHGLDRAKYGDAIVERLAQDLTARLGRGFSRRNVFLMRAFYLGFPRPIVQTASALSSESDTSQPIVQTVSAKSAPAGKCQTPSGESVSVIRSTPSKISETPSRNSAVKLASFDLPDLARAVEFYNLDAIIAVS